MPVTIADSDAALALADVNRSGDIDADEELDVAVAAGLAEVGGIVRSFLCPVIPQPGR